MTAEQKREIAWDAKYYLQEAKILLETIGEVDLARWPQYKQLYIDAFDEMFQARMASGKTNHNRLWTCGEGIFRWWIGEGQNNIDSQTSLFDEEE